MKKKIVYLTTTIGIALCSCMPIMAKTIISSDDVYIEPHYYVKPQEKICTLDQGIYTKDYLIGLILSGKIYKSGNGFYIDGEYYSPDYSNSTVVPKCKTDIRYTTDIRYNKK